MDPVRKYWKIMFNSDTSRYFEIRLPIQEGEINYVIFSIDAESVREAVGKLTNDGFWRKHAGVSKATSHGPVVASYY